MTYRTAEVNFGLYRIYDDDRFVGFIRRGMDGKWYPELPAERSRGAAIHRLILIDTALIENPIEVL